ncbi:autotransporter outer membrane beta-barrel domain-containing protein [Salmonella enterica subsp. enterica serovar Toulon]|nr:autotransporter outer membrane beta-barrel domain-containing protein [Salmonella enterica subsp. enterica serovar Toulon]
MVIFILFVKGYAPNMRSHKEVRWDNSHKNKKGYKRRPVLLKTAIAINLSMLLSPAWAGYTEVFDSDKNGSILIPAGESHVTVTSGATLSCNDVECTSGDTLTYKGVDDATQGPATLDIEEGGTITIDHHNSATTASAIKIDNFDDVTINNDGYINSVDKAIYAINNSDNIIVNNNGSIETSHHAITFDTGSSGVVNNNGAINSAKRTNATGIMINGGSVTINNNETGTIYGGKGSTSGRGIAVQNSGDAIINNKGDIIGFTNEGIVVNRDGSIELNNEGLIRGEASIAAINISSGNNNIKNEAGATIEGLINANAIKMSASGNADIENSGVIRTLGNADGTRTTVGVLVQGNSTTNIINNASGEISAVARYALESANNAVLNITNSGLIASTNNPDGPGEAVEAINFGSSKGGSLTLDTGSEIRGDVMVSAGAVALTLKGEGSEDSNFKGSNDTLGFDQLTMQGDDWMLSGDVALSGTSAETLLVNAGTLTLTGKTNQLNNGGTTITNGTLRLKDNASLNGTIDINNEGTLLIDSPDSNDYTVNNTLKGTGTLAVDLDATDNAFAFGNNPDSTFSGTVDLRQGTIDLNNDINVNALLPATLSLGAEAVATLTSNTAIGKLTLAGGQLDVNMVSPNQTSVLTVDYLDVSSSSAAQSSTVNLVDTMVTDAPQTPVGNLFDQDDADTNGGILVVAATNGVSQSGVQLNLTMDGETAAPRSYEIQDSELHTATATYDYTAISTRGDNTDPAGLYISYALTSLENNDPDALFVLDASTAKNSTMGAQLSGEGGFTFHTNSDDTITLVNTDNDYHGNTRVDNGTLAMGGDGVMGNTNELNIVGGANVDMNGYEQTVGVFEGTEGSTLDIDGGKLIITNGGHSKGALTGDGTLTLDGGEMEISGANDTLSADINIKSDATAKLNNVSGLGNGSVTLDGTLVFDNINDATFANTLSGTGTVDMKASDIVLADSAGYNGDITVDSDSQLTISALGDGNLTNNGNLIINTLDDRSFATNINGAGSLTKLGDGVASFSGNNTYSGDTYINEGTLWLTDTGTIGNAGSSQDIYVAEGATFGGSGSTINANVINDGTVSFGDATHTSAIFTINGNMDNSGAITSNGNAPGNTLLINGNYTAGDNASLTLNTQLGDDNSPTDKLIVTGDTTGDTTTLYINNIGGQGALTNQGINVIEVGGQSDGDFTLGNRVAINAYEYGLYQVDGDWYLQSKGTGDDDSDSADSGSDSADSGSDSADSGSSADSSGNDNGSGSGGGSSSTPQYRADIGAYLGNQWMVRNLQMQTLYDREGSQYHTADGGVWARFKAGSADSTAADGNVDIDNNYSQIQLGGDVLAWSNGSQSFSVGLMGSYITADTDSQGNRGANGSQYTATGNVSGYNVGIYATWFADTQTHQGAYLDSWYQYGTYNNTVDNGELGSTDYDSTAHAVSLETGYRYDIGLNNGNLVSLTPQAQVTWQHYDAENVTDRNGTHISGQDNNSWASRLGLRVAGTLNKKDGNVIQPFAEANWLYTSDDASVTFGTTTVKQNIPANRAELKAGIQVNLGQQWSINAQAAGQKGSDDYSDLNGSLNLRYNW